MNLLIIAISSATGSSEISRRAYNLVRCAASRSEVLRITVVVGEWQASDFRSSLEIDEAKMTIASINISNDAFTRNLWHLHRLLSLAHKSAADLICLLSPVLIRRNTLRFREIAEKACHYFDLHAVTKSNAIRSALAESAKPAKRFERFSLESVSSEHVALYGKLTEASLRVMEPRGRNRQ